MATIVALDANGKPIGQGSGFVVKSDGVLLTNWHVLQGAASASVTLASGERFDRVVFLEGDSSADIAVIKIPGHHMKVVSTTSDIPPAGAKAVAIGSPLGLSQTVSEGIVSSVRIVTGKQLVQISVPISSGSSGGAVFDGLGRVFAISTAYLEGGQQLNFAVPIKYHARTSEVRLDRKVVSCRFRRRAT